MAEIMFAPAAPGGNILPAVRAPGPTPAGGRVPAVPAAVLFEAAARCHLGCACRYNVWKDGGRPPADPDPARAGAFLEKVVREARPRSVAFTGGEPLLRADLPDLVRPVAARGIPAQVITAGRSGGARRSDRGSPP